LIKIFSKIENQFYNYLLLSSNEREQVKYKQTYRKNINPYDKIACIANSIKVPLILENSTDEYNSPAVVTNPASRTKNENIQK